MVCERIYSKIITVQKHKRFNNNNVSSLLHLFSRAKRIKKSTEEKLLSWKNKLWIVDQYGNFVCSGFENYCSKWFFFVSKAPVISRTILVWIHSPPFENPWIFYIKIKWKILFEFIMQHSIKQFPNEIICV